MRILVTGGAGYIGSHTCVCLLQNGWRVIGIDNFSNSSPRVLDRIEQITQRSLSFHRMDVRDSTALSTLLERQKVDAVIHFAGAEFGDFLHDRDFARDAEVAEALGFDGVAYLGEG